jgi:hypothetical protein
LVARRRVTQSSQFHIHKDRRECRLDMSKLPFMITHGWLTTNVSKTNGNRLLRHHFCAGDTPSGETPSSQACSQCSLPTRWMRRAWGPSLASRSCGCTLDLLFEVKKPPIDCQNSALPQSNRCDDNNNNKVEFGRDTANFSQGLSRPAARLSACVMPAQTFFRTWLCLFVNSRRDLVKAV